jgi:oligopeptide transport system ATP-binding protein
MTQLLEVKDLAVHFAGKRREAKKVTVKAVDGLSFSLGNGETLGLVGESGCGKSTTGMAIQGLVDPTAGSIVLDGVDVTASGRRARRAARRLTQMVFQDPTSSLNVRMTVEETLSEPLIIHHVVPAADRRARVLQLLDMVGLPAGAAERYPHEFSGGQRQRLGIARALAAEPRLINCDEPTAALDVSIRGQILNLFRRLQDEHGLSYLFISHDLAAIHHVSDRLLVMYLGRPMELASREALFKDPRHPYTAALMSAVPVPDPKLERARERILLRGDVPSPISPPSGCVFRTRCPMAQQICADEVPQWRDVGTGSADGQHLVACHFAAPGVQQSMREAMREAMREPAGQPA